MSNDWKTRAGFLSPKFVEHEVAGAKIKFWPISVGKAVRLKTVAAPLVDALVILFGGYLDQANTQISRRYPTEDGEGSETRVEAMSIETLTLRNGQRSGAIAKAIEALTQPESLAVIGEVLKDSMREVFEDDKTPPLEIAAALSPAELRQALAGLARANAEVFGPFAEGAGKMLVRVLGGLSLGSRAGSLEIEAAVSEAIAGIAEKAAGVPSAD
jgi:hypothetical protein